MRNRILARARLRLVMQQTPRDETPGELVVRHVLRVTLIGILVSGSVHSQPTPRFEVASVRVLDKPSGVSQRITDTRVNFTNVTLRSVMLIAFRIPDYSLIGPSWLENVAVDIQATIPGGISRQFVPEMLQELLIERFDLKTHRETRQMDGFELTKGAKGVAMREVKAVDDFDKQFASDPEAPAEFRALADRVVDTPDGSERRVLLAQGVTTITHRTMYSFRPPDLINFTRVLEATRMTMSELAVALTRNIGKPVIDRTNLPGIYQFTIKLPLDFRLLAIERRARTIPDDPSGVSPLTAVGELGLKLDARRVPVDVLIVDQVRRIPAEN